MDTRDETIKDVVNSVGIVYQLMVTRFNQIVTDDFVPFSQFILLSHFVKDVKKPRTVSSVASAFQAPQPGITKTIRKLVDQGLMTEEANPKDGRSHHLFLTKKGAATYNEAIKKLAPDMRQIFASVPEKELHALHSSLTKIRIWLDENRLENKL